MPLSSIKGNTRRRFLEVHTNLALIESLEPKLHEEVPLQVNILKGFYYVHLYAVLEKTINEVVEHTLLLINSKNIANKHHLTAFNVISLNAKMQGFKSCGFKDYFNYSVSVFNSIESDESFEINNTIFAKPLQNVYFETIQETLMCFGIPGVEVDPRVRFTVNEIVEKRNAVAHGRETPATVGERYRCDMLRTKTAEIQLTADKVIDKFETYISEQGYIQEPHRHSYLTA